MGRRSHRALLVVCALVAFRRSFTGFVFLKTAELGTSRRSHLTARYAESPLDRPREKAKNPEDVDLVEVVAEAEDADDEKLARKLTEYDDISDSIALAAVKDAQENNPEVEIELARAAPTRSFRARLENL
eukprot:g15611.t1